MTLRRDRYHRLHQLLTSPASRPGSGNAPFLPTVRGRVTDTPPLFACPTVDRWHDCFSLVAWPTHGCTAIVHIQPRGCMSPFRGGLAPGGSLGVRVHFPPETQRPKTSRPFHPGAWSKGRVYTRACRSGTGLYILLLLRKRRMVVSRVASLLGLARRLRGGLDGNIHVNLDPLPLDRGPLDVRFHCQARVSSREIGRLEGVRLEGYVVCGRVYSFDARKLPWAERT